MISIIIVTFNAGKTLQTCLNSIYKQKYSFIEIIVIDGQSVDNTIEILKENNHKLTYWKSEPDSGIYDAMNKGLKRLNGEWTYFLGADDELLDDFSSFACKLKIPNALYYGSVLSNGQKRSGFVTEYYQAKIGIYHQAIIYSSLIFKKYQFDPKYKVSADYALNMRCWKDKDISFIFEDYIIAKFNHTGVSSIGEDDTFKKDKLFLIKQNFGFVIWFRYLFRLLKIKIQKQKKALSDAEKV